MGCPMEIALAALEWTKAVGVLPDEDLIHAARLTSETAAAVIERKVEGQRQYIYLGPRLDAPPMDVFEGKVLFDEPGVKAVEFSQRAHALAHFLRATSGAGACWPSSVGERRRSVICAAGWVRSSGSSTCPGPWWVGGLPPRRPAACYPPWMEK